MKAPAYILSRSLVNACDKIPVISKRASMITALLQATSCFNKLNIISSVEASVDDIRAFHSEDYVQYIISADDSNEEEDDSYGLGFDCPLKCDTWSLVKEIAGASLLAAETLIKGESDIVINWYGGWHHGQRDSASGFCYVNDVVLCIQKLCQKYEKILYIDMDVHHGDGVENAFLFSSKVMTVSFHQFEPGFFPGSGKLTDVGMGKGKLYSVNVPYKSGINDSQFCFLFKNIINEVMKIFVPSAIVCQCGADTLSKDPLGEANVSLEGYMNCVKLVLGLRKPLVLLGGGGYNNANAAKLWTAITLSILGESIPEEIPEHNFFPLYGPDFTFNVSRSLRKTENTPEYLNDIINFIKGNLKNIKKSVDG
ncbi:UNVERIFIED_CONTAM: hypothetical protein RMT77_015743 [Armadillidium vulgare]